MLYKCLQLQTKESKNKAPKNIEKVRIDEMVKHGPKEKEWGRGAKNESEKSIQYKRRRDSKRINEEFI